MPQWNRRCRHNHYHNLLLPTIHPVPYDINGETEPDKSVKINFDALDKDKNNLNATIIREPDCGFQVTNQTEGSKFTYTAKSISSISNSKCQEMNLWVGTIVFHIRLLMAKLKVT